jgi:ribosome maturation factor RimP
MVMMTKRQGWAQQPAFFVTRIPAALPWSILTISVTVLIAPARRCSAVPGQERCKVAAGDELKLKVSIAIMSLLNTIARIITPTIEAMGFELVRVQISGNQRRALQIMAEPKDGRQMSVDDCADLSRAISAVLDVEDPISDAYSLEVSSPGIDRPLTRPKDYERFLGHEAKLETIEPVDGRKRFRGSLLAVTEAGVRLMAEEGEVTLSFDNIHKAKLVLTDALIALHQQPHTLEN